VDSACDARGAAGEHDRRCRPARGAGGLCGGHSRGWGCHLGQGGVVAVGTSGTDWRGGATAEQVAALRR